MAGRPLGFRGCLLHLKGDWEAFANLLHLPRWDNTLGICFKCTILRTELLDSSSGLAPSLGAAGE
eukprot:724541-Amphidinium_carterae.1